MPNNGDSPRFAMTRGYSSHATKNSALKVATTATPRAYPSGLVRMARMKPITASIGLKASNAQANGARNPRHSSATAQRELFP